MSILLGLVVVVGVAALWVFACAKKSAASRPRGWASFLDLYANGLLFRSPGQSVAIGTWRNVFGGRHCLRDASSHPVLCVGSPDKGSGLSVQTLLSYEHSAVVADLRGMLFERTSGYRYQQGQRVYRYAPAEEKSVRWNPLDEVRVHTDDMLGDVQLMVDSLLAGQSRGLGLEQQRLAEAGLKAALLFALLESSERATLSSVERMLADPGLWTQMVASDHALVSKCGAELVITPANQVAATVQVLKRCLAPFREPIVAANTSRSDFELQELRQHVRPHTLYLVIQPKDIEQAGCVGRLLVAMAARKLATTASEQDGERGSSQHPVLMLLDDFTALGRVAPVEEYLADFRVSRVQVFLCCRDIVSLREVYGRLEEISAGCQTQVFLGPVGGEEAEYLAERLSSETLGFGSQVATEYGERGWAKLTGEECQILLGNSGMPTAKPGSHNLVVLSEGCRPVFGFEGSANDYRRMRARLLNPKVEVANSLNVK